MKVRPSILRCLAPRVPVVLLLLCVLTTAVGAATVRGRLDRVYSNGARHPATGVAVSLYSRNLGRSRPTFAGRDGIYYFYNVPAGPYYLEVWTSRDPRVRPTLYPVTAIEPYSDIPPIVVKP